MRRIGSGFRAVSRRPLTLVVVLLAATTAAGLLAGGAMDRWHHGVVRRNLAYTEAAARHLSLEAEAQWSRWPLLGMSEGVPVVDVTHDDMDRSLKVIANGVFAAGHTLKGGFWVLQQDEFIGYADPWSPPPAPAFGPPPRSYPVILQQVRESLAGDRPLAQVHEFDSVSVGKTVFTLATHPVRRDGRIVAVAWARIHLEKEMPSARLRPYVNLGALVTLGAFVAALLASLLQRREIRSLSDDLRRIEGDPTARLARRTGMFGSIRDAVNRVLASRAEESRRRQALEEQLHQQDKMAALGNLLAGVAHEIKTPLAIVKTRVQIWQRDLDQFSRRHDVPAPLQDESMQLVLGEIDRLSGLLNRLLYFSRPVRQDLMRPLDVNDLIRHTVMFARPRIVQRRVDLDLSLDPAACRIHGDADSLHQAFLNIVTNALDHVDEGGMFAVASRLDHGSGQVVLDFTDNGPGLAPEVRAQAFNPFFTTRHGGSGLGLSITYEIVKAHCGTIEFVEPEVRGAHCRIRLPALVDNAEGK